MNATINKIKPLDDELLRKAKAHIDNLTKPLGSLGYLEEIAMNIYAIQQRDIPNVDKKCIVTMAGDHGVTEEGVSAFPQEVTMQMLLNFIAGGAAVNVFANTVNADVFVADLGVKGDTASEPYTNIPNFINKKVDNGTNNFAKGPAMTREQAELSLKYGIDIANELAQKGYSLVGTGDMGIGNTTPSAAIFSVLANVAPSEITGRGTGIDDEKLKNKIEIIQAGINVNEPKRDDPVDILSKVGGFEIGGIAGLILGCAANSIPVVVDGFISTAGAMIASALAPNSKSYMFFAHLSNEQGHKKALSSLNVKPILDLGLRLGEGTGGAIAFHIIQCAVNMFNNMATFESAGVSNKED